MVAPPTTTSVSTGCSGWPSQLPFRKSWKYFPGVPSARYTAFETPAMPFHRPARGRAHRSIT